jgi:dimethylaniline monooxygenase (N-oxide forming)
MKDICILGAGSSGVTVAKALKEQGLEFDCFEKGSDIGGMWRYENDSGLSSAYASLHIDTSRQNLGYSDFPIAGNRRDFLSHAEFLAHLEAYADRADVRSSIRFNTTVEAVDRAPDGRWVVRLQGGETRTYGTVIIANGHLSDPRMPNFPGCFAGDQIHSHHYRTAAPYDGKNVLVVGLGNSAVDIAVDLARRARGGTMSTRRSAWIMPKYVMGIPVDRWSTFLSSRLRLPTRIVRMIMARVVRLAQGDQERFGVPKPQHPMWREHATLSQELLPYLGHGWIKMKPNVNRLDGKQVRFEDGSVEEFDAIIYATGYKTSFPFLAPGLFQAEKKPVNLYRRILSSEHPGLFFAGLIQPVGPTIPLVEVQAKWLASVLAKKVRLPDRDTMQAEISAHHDRQKRTYLDSDRYVLEVDFKTYAGQMRTDMEAGLAGV